MYNDRVLYKNKMTEAKKKLQMIDAEINKRGISKS
jgi:hypothetical protein